MFCQVAIMLWYLPLCIVANYQSLIVFGLNGPHTTAVSKISSDLFSKLELGETLNILVGFIGGTKHVLESVSQKGISDYGERATALYQALHAKAEKSQSGVISFLKSKWNSLEPKRDFKNFWISNQMWIRDADLNTVRHIAEDPHVAYIKRERTKTLMTTSGTSEKRKYPFPYPAPAPGTIQWNIQAIGAPQAWQEIGSKGEGVTIGFIDTGARATHETLRHNFRGEYGWYDATPNRKLEPYDDGQHGTHVTAVAVGANGIGVAPGATWAACKGCLPDDCLDNHLLECAQFFACPTLADGSHPNCTKVPRIVSNSWGGYGEEDYDDVLAAWKLIGIIPVFAIGNSPPAFCGSAVYPAYHADVIGVGNVNRENTTDGARSQNGPTTDGRIKPDLAAPGQEIVSALGDLGDKFGDDKYRMMSGTSQAGPHVAGAVALLLAREKRMTIDQVKQYLFSSAERRGLQIPKNRCSPVKNGTFVWPNNNYGWGLVNVYKAVKLQSLALSMNRTKSPS